MFATDVILSALMASTKSIIPWDIVVTKSQGKLFFDRRENAQIELITVDETANEVYSQEENPNTPQTLAQEAGLINQCFSQQVLKKKAKRVELEQPSPFASEATAPVGYRYQSWDLGDGVKLVARCEVDAVDFAKGKQSFLSVKALNEYNVKSNHSASWRRILDKQRGAVLATELKNNTNKLTRWAAQAALAGVDQICLGFVSRANANAKDNLNHRVLGVHFYSLREFAVQINLNMKNLWAVLKEIIDHLMQQDDGKYVVMRDPKNPRIIIYKVPENTFDDLRK